MTHFRKCWNDERNKWICERATLDRKADYIAFCERFGVSDITFTAFSNQRSRLKVNPANRAYHSTRHRPIGSEHVKKGYVRVKIAEPNVWRFKHWVAWEKAHPNEPSVREKLDTVIFLDGDNRNFSPDNLCKVERKIMGILNGQFGGVSKGNPSETLAKIECAKLKHEMINQARKHGLVGSAGSLKCVVNERCREYRKRADVKERIKKASKICYERMKTERPEEYERRKIKHKEYMREYCKRRREKVAVGDCPKKSD